MLEGSKKSINDLQRLIAEEPENTGSPEWEAMETLGKEQMVFAPRHEPQPRPWDSIPWSEQKPQGTTCQDKHEALGSVPS